MARDQSAWSFNNTLRVGNCRNQETDETMYWTNVMIKAKQKLAKKKLISLREYLDGLLTYTFKDKSAKSSLVLRWESCTHVLLRLSPRDQV